MDEVTFVIPCFNHGSFVGEAVDSCLRQEGVDVRVVIVNDGSDDGTTASACDACAGERVVVIHQENRGLSAARNRGAAGITSEFVVFLDADDMVRPGFAAKLIGRLREAGGRDVSHAYCQEELVGLGTGVWEVPEWDPTLLCVTNLHPVTCVVRRACFEAVGGFDETMRGGYEDWDLWLKFTGLGWRGVRVREPLFVWRRHSHSTMVMNVIHDHRALYQRLIENHRGLFEPRMEELLVYTNTLLRKFDMNWIDETGFPRQLRYLRGVHQKYESSGAISLQRRIGKRVDAMPGPMRGLVRRILGRIKHAGS